MVRESAAEGVLVHYYCGACVISHEGRILESVGHHSDTGTAHRRTIEEMLVLLKAPHSVSTSKGLIN
jgi:hypothetical protein